MQTFLKMSSVVYSMAGLGSVEESKVYRERFSADDDKDSLKDEANLTTTKLSEKVRLSELLQTMHSRNLISDFQKEFDEADEDDDGVFSGSKKDTLDVPAKMKRSWLPSSTEVNRTIGTKA